MDDDEKLKKEDNIKIEFCDQERKRTVYEEVVQQIQDAKLLSSKAHSTTKETFYLLFPSEEAKCSNQQCDTVTVPLMSAIESLEISLSALKSLESLLFDISCETELNGDIEMKEELEGDDDELQEEKNENDEDFYGNDSEVDGKEEEEEEGEDDQDMDVFEMHLKTEPLEIKPDEAGVYNCDLCDYSTSERRYLKQHKQRRHEAGKYKCEVCDYVTHKAYIMKAHMTKDHKVKKVEYLVDRKNPDIRYYLCKQCPYSNSSQAALDAHVQNKHTNKMKKEKEQSDEEEEVGEEESEYSCTKCSYVTNKKKYFEDHTKGVYKYRKCPWCPEHFPTGKFKKGKFFGTHLKNVHGCKTENGDFKCVVCGLEVKQTSDLEFHLGKVHELGTKYHCPQCDYSSWYIQYYKLHIVDHQAASHPCPECPHLAKSNHRLEKHIYENHTSIKCDTCDLVLENQKELLRHKRVVHGHVEICDICGNSYSARESLITHKNLKHGKKKIQCELCDFKTVYRSMLKAHALRKHANQYDKMKFKNSKDKTYLCEQCDYSAHVKSALQEHIKIKHLNWRLTCDICDAKFTAGPSLKRHKMKHDATSATKLKCEEADCTYSTHDSGNLKQHKEKVHQGIRWPCEHCDYVGGYKADLTRHIKIVHQGFILKCEMCDYTTPKKYYLKGHMLKVHGCENQI